MGGPRRRSALGAAVPQRAPAQRCVGAPPVGLALPPRPLRAPPPALGVGPTLPAGLRGGDTARRGALTGGRAGLKRGRGVRGS